MTGRAAVRLPLTLRRELIAQARRAAPDECCGLLLGTRRAVRLVAAMTNVDAQPRRRFTIDPREHVELRRWLRRLTPPLEIVGVYHSHPAGPASPSASDIVEAHYPDWIHLVVGLGGARTRASVAAFEIARGRATRVRLLPRG